MHQFSLALHLVAVMAEGLSVVVDAVLDAESSLSSLACSPQYREGSNKCLSKNIFTYTANFQDVVRYGAMTVLGLNEAE